MKDIQSLRKFIMEHASVNEDQKFIQKAIKHPGALHKDLGVPEGEKIPVSIMAKKHAELSKKSEAGTITPKESHTLRRINFAKTLKKLHK